MSVTTSAPTDSAAHRLKELCGDIVHLPGDPSYDAVRMPWNVAVDQRPAAVAVPASADQVAAVVRHCAVLGLRVAPQSTGHAAAALVQHDLDDVVVLRTGELRGVTVDAERRVARVGGGTLWQEVVEAAAPHGLAALHGSSPDVAVAGYALGGGIGWYARKLGLATNSITAVELVTADGEQLRATTEENAELFWAVRGGGGSFGVVTALELRLFPIADAYAGMMLWDLQHAEKVVRHWAAWSATAPEEVTTALRVMRFPPMPELPEFLRGRQLVVVDGAVLGDDERGAELVAGLRALEPEMDTFARTPAAALSRLHMDPEGPTPSVGGSACFDALTDGAVDAFLAAVGPGVQTSLMIAELRQLGGALGRPAPDGGALSMVPAAYLGFFVAIAATPEMAQQGMVDVARTTTALEPWSNGKSFLNFAEGPADVAAAYEEGAWARLRAVRSAVDPREVFLANHVVPGE
ncbi:FAD-binding oxidoreductase [Nocardioides caldifontis]|uniref:FAD-binding oxidoreductase n=1 Tax=Nocardioides caldifontis TaxID=2588938 RepID=UPI0011E01DB1|nr:FAD-binding oxidoreductase [Nocardioides caldifontis]